MTDAQYEIRPARDDEMDRVHFLVAYSFTGDRTLEGRAKMRHLEEMARPQVLIDGGEIVASLRVYPFRMLVNGAPVDMGGVSAVSCLPEHRRKGHVGRMLEHALAEMRDRGQLLSALYTPHPDLYRRYGWMTAAANLKYTWNPKHVRPYIPERPPGRAERVTEEDWPLIAAVYEQFIRGRTGPIERTEARWKEAFFRDIYDDSRAINDVAVWRNEAGEATGYVSYRPRQKGDRSVVEVKELVSLSGEAQTGLLRYILSHDLNDEITWYGPVEDGFSFTVDNPQLMKREFVEDLMLRVVDLPAAVAARPAGAGTPDGAFTLELADAACPWNSGTWRVTAEDGRLEAAKADGAGQVAMTAATFGAVYDGYLRTSDAVRTGLAQSADTDAMAHADRAFASDSRPLCYDFF
jgi:predicted acetyltransferase